MMMGKIKLFLLAFIGFMVIGVLPAAAQEDKWGKANTSDLYYVNVPVEKVYTYRKGYIVVFRKGSNTMETTYIPYSWFRVNVRKAELVQLADGTTQPCMTVFYKEGKFHTVRLYVAKRGSHQTWGMIPSTTNIDDRFENIESIDIGFDSSQ
jgi:predicted CoA-binding protein